MIEPERKGNESASASWGYINSSSGAYTAGPFSSVTDVVQVADSLGNLATVCVSGGGGACPL